MAKNLNEFDLIADLFAPLSRSFPGAIGLTDDAAYMPGMPQTETVVTMDSMVAGIHFFASDPPDLIARKLIRVNLSDLAAKAACPYGVMLAAAFPRGTDPAWLRQFAAGLAQDCDEFKIALIGGDTVTTDGPLTVTMTAFGTIPNGRRLLRNQARLGDDVWVTGSLGDAALGLLVCQSRLTDVGDYLRQRYLVPMPRLGLRPVLLRYAHASMDISDGLVQDFGHICTASGVAGHIWADCVPLSAAAHQTVAANPGHLSTVLTGGDDYEILFTAPPHFATEILHHSQSVGVDVRKIGTIITGSGIHVLDAAGSPVSIENAGWQHF